MHEERLLAGHMFLKASKTIIAFWTKKYWTCLVFPGILSVLDILQRIGRLYNNDEKKDLYKKSSILYNYFKIWNILDDVVWLLDYGTEILSLWDLLWDLSMRRGKIRINIGTVV
ncbi:hypothetical protein ACJX0J_035059, partial [Zea mays]